MQASSPRVQKNAFCSRLTADCTTVVEDIIFTHKPAAGEKPAHWHARILDSRRGVDVHLRDGLTPPNDDKPFLADVEVKERVVDGSKSYVYLNLYPPASKDAQFLVRVTRTPIDLSGVSAESRKDKENYVDQCVDANGTVTIFKLKK